MCHDEPKIKRDTKDGEHIPSGTHIVMDAPNMFVNTNQPLGSSYNSQQQQSQAQSQSQAPNQHQHSMSGSSSQSPNQQTGQDQFFSSNMNLDSNNAGGNNGVHGNTAHPISMNHNPVFFSEHAGSEFSSLNDFLSIIDDPSLLDQSFLDINDPKVEHASLKSQGIQKHQGTNSNNSSVAQGRGGTAGQTSGQAANTQLSGDPMDSAKDKFFLTAADPSEDISPEERLKQVIHAKVEAGLLQPFNYALGYQRLQRFMDNYMNQSSKQRILKPLSILRPAFRAVAQSLKDVDLVLVEESFERMLLEYDRVFTSMAIPACLWRRTGEIYRGNKEFAGLVDVNVEDLRDGKLAIYELMSEESAVNYWEKYANIAFDSGQKAVLTSCNLRARDGRKRRACCFSFTVRRDRYNIPSCIIGNFIPVHN